MSVTIPVLPVQVEPPATLGGRATVDSTLRVAQGAVTATIEYEVQPHHVALGYRVAAGASRSEPLGNGDQVKRHWFVLDGPGTLNVVDCLIRARAPGQTDRTRGFAILVDNP